MHARTDTVTPLTVRQLARILDITEMAIRDWEDGSHIRRPFSFQRSKRGTRTEVRIDPRELEGWLAEYRPDLLQILVGSVEYRSLIQQAA